MTEPTSPPSAAATDEAAFEAKYEALVNALAWVLANDGECLGDHPKLRAEFQRRYDAAPEVSAVAARSSQRPSPSVGREAVLKRIIDRAVRNPVPEHVTKSYRSGFDAGYGLGCQHAAEDAQIALAQPATGAVEGEEGWRSRAYQTWRAYIDLDPKLDAICHEAWTAGGNAALRAPTPPTTEAGR